MALTRMKRRLAAGFCISASSLRKSSAEQINKDQLQRYFVKRLQRLCLKVTLELATAAA